MYTFTITAIPTNTDPTQSVVTATLSDNAGAAEIIRNYSLPTSSNPKPSGFQTLIEADIDELNAAQSAREALATTLISQTAVPVDNEAIEASIGLQIENNVSQIED